MAIDQVLNTIDLSRTLVLFYAAFLRLLVEIFYCLVVLFADAGSELYTRYSTIKNVILIFMLGWFLSMNHCCINDCFINCSNQFDIFVTFFSNFLSSSSILNFLVCLSCLKMMEMIWK